MTDRTVSHAIERGIYFLFVNRAAGSLLGQGVQSPFRTNKLWLNCCLQANALIERSIPYSEYQE